MWEKNNLPSSHGTLSQQGLRGSLAPPSPPYNLGCTLTMYTSICNTHKFTIIEKNKKEPQLFSKDYNLVKLLKCH